MKIQNNNSKLTFSINNRYLIALSIVSSFIFSVFNQHISTELVVDELFHYRQTKTYCQYKFSEWDDKITTLPGLYVLGFLYNQMINFILSIVYPKTLHECSLPILRSFNTILLVFNFIIFYKIIQFNSQRNNRNSIYQKSLLLVLLPIYYFFHYLYYTDVPSTLSVLLVYYYSLKKQYFVSSMIGIYSVFIRQTNIIWVFFTALTSILTLQQEKENSNSNQESSLFNEIVSFIRFTIKNLLTIVSLLWGYILVGIMFLVFLKVNGGIVVGDKGNHESSLHFVQLFYFSVFTLVFTLPSNLLSSETSPLRFINTITQNLKRSSIKFITLYSLVLSVMVFLVKKFTYIHIFILSDNRHYVFYLFNRIILKYTYSRYALIPLYCYCIWSMWVSLTRTSKKSKIWCIFYILCTIAVLLPSPLVEPRYYIVPFFIYQLNNYTDLQSPKLLTLNIILTIFINIITIYVFITFPFQYPDGSVGRFFW
ncbi:glycosyltransferase [Tieghemostelium lacteum]|uniref:Dol-P-Glc:Glc(2)Man(9)GlcNAc(2)-PP-Dol alpha-1,2-glucosyltransferase n=1 Tax=Tieghemostelium lacteum TaxID=361077 RepID=A0A152A450_TIELA|nr:glycosyltransferase [Tieghemostelium lacteum]|eukprot:KYR00865.1 glycosyltransferase [Tieghemostelium lacteum]